MIPRTTARAAAFIGLYSLLAGRPALAAPGVLRSADAQITQTSPLACEVRLALSIEGADEVEHRLATLQGSVVTLIESPAAAPPHDVGRTRALVVRPSSATYTLRYLVQQPPEGAFRCPLWLPTTPADGRSRAVRITARLPAGAQPTGTMPSFSWANGVGTATLGHLPAFVRLPYEADGVRAPWNLARVMDGVSVGVLVVASLVWLRRSRTRGDS
jgi:hypothetical protein